MDEGGAGCAIAAAVLLAVGFVLYMVGRAIYFSSVFVVWLFGTHISTILGLAAMGMMAGAIYHQRRSGTPQSGDAAAKIGPVEASPKSWFYGSTMALVGALLVYRIFAF